MNPTRGAQAAYLLVVLLQVGWHLLLPVPHGNESGVLALISVAPLLFPISGILKGRIRSMTWGAYLLVLYFVLGIMETWSNPPQRIVALTQVLITLLYFTCLLILVRQSPRDEQ